MPNQIQLITFGGTLLMKERPDGGLAPFYGVEDVVLYQRLKQRHPALAQELITHGHAAYPQIGRALAGAGAVLDEAQARDVALKQARGDIARLGFSPHIRALDYQPIDSINFDIDTHYASLRAAVLETIRKGDVPVVVGGTDTMRFYGALLAEDLQYLHRSGRLPHLPPVILATSMLAFGDTHHGVEQDHVYRLFKAVRVAADEAVIHGKSGVFAIAPADAAVGSASLIDMQRPADKLSGSTKIVKAFVGEGVPEIGAVDPDRPMPGKVYPHYDGRRVGDGQAQEIPPFGHRPVAPPIEASNGMAGLAAFLRGLAQDPQHGPFKAVVVKYPLAGNAGPALGFACEAITALRKAGVDVIFVRDPVIDAQGRLAVPPDVNEAQHARELAKLQRAGAMVADGMTSTQAVIRAGMVDERQQPVWFGAERQAATRAAETCTAAKAGGHGLPRLERFAIEYIPDAPAYAAMVRLLDGMGVKKLVSINCTDGAMGVQHRATFTGLKSMTQVVCSFKYAGRDQGGFIESASMEHYAPSVALRAALPCIQPGEEQSPSALMQASGRYFN